MNENQFTKTFFVLQLYSRSSNVVLRSRSLEKSGSGYLFVNISTTSMQLEVVSFMFMLPLKNINNNSVVNFL